MPVKPCPNGKWRIGSGPCTFSSKAEGERVYHYLMSKGKIKGHNSKARSIAAKQRMSHG